MASFRLLRRPFGTPRNDERQGERFMKTQQQSEAINVLLEEKRSFQARESFRKTAWVQDEKIYESASKNPEAFWSRFAEELVWIKKWDRVLHR